MLRRVALVRSDVSEELNASIIRVTRIDELGTTLAVTSNRRKLRRGSHIFYTISPQMAVGLSAFTITKITGNHFSYGSTLRARVWLQLLEGT
jgi:hypothetical protein